MASAELHPSGSNFQMVETLQKVCVHVLVHSGPCAPGFTSSFTQICNHMHLLPAHTITHTTACLLTEQELAQNRKQDFLCEPGIAAVKQAISYRRERNRQRQKKWLWK